MARNKKRQQPTDIQGESFDLVLEFNGSLSPQLFMTEDMEFVLTKLIEEQKRVRVRVNWWSEGLKLEFPDSPVTPQERLRDLLEVVSTIDMGTENKAA
jgi:hypothetical protein